jgi:hypothetical protein
MREDALKFHVQRDFGPAKLLHFCFDKVRAENSVASVPKKFDCQPSTLTGSELSESF